MVRITALPVEGQAGLGEEAGQRVVNAVDRKVAQAAFGVRPHGLGRVEVRAVGGWLHDSVGAAPRALASFRNLTLNTYRLAGRADIAHARRRRTGPCRTVYLRQA